MWTEIEQLNAIFIRVRTHRELEPIELLTRSQQLTNSSIATASFDNIPGTLPDSRHFVFSLSHTRTSASLHTLFKRDRFYPQSNHTNINSSPNSPSLQYFRMDTSSRTLHESWCVFLPPSFGRGTGYSGDDSCQRMFQCPRISPVFI